MVTVFCPFTRPWAVASFFAALEASDVPRDRFVAYVDSEDASLEAAVLNRASGLFEVVETHLSGVAPPPERIHPRHRRKRQAQMRTASQACVGDDELLLLEDDTLIPADTFARLSETRRDFDWVVGAEVGRWGTCNPVGAWRIAEESGGLRIASMMPSGAPVDRADATGLYCVLTSAAVYREADFGAWDDRIGHDIHTTVRLSRAGRRLAVDWRVPCVHLTAHGTRLTMADAKQHSWIAPAECL